MKVEPVWERLTVGSDQEVEPEAVPSAGEMPASELKSAA
jgi:hypothetical protein